VNARVLVGLLVPVGGVRPLELCAVADTAAAISDLLGGVLLDDTDTWNLGCGGFVSVYRAEDRAGLPDNQRLCMLATRLGIVDRALHTGARGDVLLLGATRHGRDTDVPVTVTAAADRCGYPIAFLPSPAPAPEPAVGPCLLPGLRSHVPHTDGPEWTLGHRARQLYLDLATLAGDLTRIGLPVPVSRLGAILAGDQPAPATVLAGLVDTLELRDPAVHDRLLVTAVTRSWQRAGWRVPTEILTILAVARNLTVAEVGDIAASGTPTG
jgi:hypothetical protein